MLARGYLLYVAISGPERSALAARRPKKGGAAAALWCPPQSRRRRLPLTMQADPEDVQDAAWARDFNNRPSDGSGDSGWLW